LCRIRLGGVLNNLAMLLNDEGRLDQARQVIGKAIDHQQSAHKKEPKDEMCRRFLRNHYSVLAEICLKQEDHDGLAKAAVEPAKLFPDDGQEYYAAAEFLVRCLTLVEKDTE